MSSFEYTRSGGRRLTYQIRVDGRGCFSVLLDGKHLMSGRDRLAAGGRTAGPNKRKVAGAVNQAQREIESLAQMDEA
ncbi:MAG: hypothetical protein EOO30_11680 [Comamonadaceae bacterium]|nr:MAG: hypothetical protein EOO30_11680 [Comamonadaceae bacterium]